MVFSFNTSPLQRMQLQFPFLQIQMKIMRVYKSINRVLVSLYKKESGRKLNSKQSALKHQTKREQTMKQNED